MNTIDELKGCSKFFDFGKVDFWGSGSRVNEVTITISFHSERMYTPGKGWDYTGKTDICFSGEIWNRTHTDIVKAGQCQDTLDKFEVKDNQELFKEILDLWKRYHLKHLEDIPEEGRIRLLNVFKNN